jgi:rhamnulokinase
MWLLQESKRAWDAAGNRVSYADLISRAESAPAFTACVDPNSSDFDAPENMPEAIAAFCRRTGQTAPADLGAFARMILESLALKYRSVKDALVRVTGKPVEKIHIIGGGSQNHLLNQFAADALGLPVIAGPVEATSIGNILMQLHGVGEIHSLSEGRALVRRSFPTRAFTPANTSAWDEAASRFQKILPA